MGLVGCQSKVTKDNYDRIKTGMTEDKVTDILGKATETSSIGGAIGPLKATGATHKWIDGDKVITVVIANDKVVSKTQSNIE